jgi:hypothetical protein
VAGFGREMRAQSLTEGENPVAGPTFWDERIWLGFFPGKDHAVGDSRRNNRWVMMVRRRLGLIWTMFTVRFPAAADLGLVSHERLPRLFQCGGFVFLLLDVVQHTRHESFENPLATCAQDIIVEKAE